VESGREAHERTVGEELDLGALEFPSGEATDVNVILVRAKRRADACELHLELQLIQLDRFAAYRAALTDPWSAPRAIRSSRRQLSGANRFSGLLSKNGLVGHCSLPQSGANSIASDDRPPFASSGNSGY
jgi:hypothetical protein